MVIADLPETAAFLSYEPNFTRMATLAESFIQYEALIVIGHGGSVTSFMAMTYSLIEKMNKRVYVVSTVDPDYITRIKKITKPQNTLVIAISKSGETVTQIEALLQFTEYPLLCITGLVGPFADIAGKMNAKLVQHPPIGGRFTAFTEVALLPALLCGIDVKTIFTAGRKVHHEYAKDNSAWHAASVIYQLEQDGKTDVFMSFYNNALFELNGLIIQLCHESFGKQGKGQTYFAHEGPESQHHTNQRFFGGPKNIIGWFSSVDVPLQDMTTTVPESVANITLKESTLGLLGNIPLSAALQYERQATMEHAQIVGIPLVHTSLPARTEESIGEFIAFWQLYAVYSASLRGVNPFDQPEVEESKRISFAKRLGYKGQR